jgi:RNA polymerase sigma factor (sigma-70 family)
MSDPRPLPPPDPPRDLIKRLKKIGLLKSRDDDAWDLIYDQSEGWLNTAAIYLVGREFAEDLVATCWLATAARIKNFNPKRQKSFFGWQLDLMREAVNDFPRRTVTLDLYEEPAALEPPTEEEAEEKAKEKAKLKFLMIRLAQALLAKLDPSDRDLFKRYHLSDLTAKQHGDRLRMTDGAVRAKVMHIRQRMRRALNDDPRLQAMVDEISMIAPRLGVAIRLALSSPVGTSETRCEKS